MITHPPLPTVEERLVELGQAGKERDLEFRTELADFTSSSRNETTRVWLRGEGGRISPEKIIKAATFLTAMDEPVQEMEKLSSELSTVVRAVAFGLISTEDVRREIQASRVTTLRILTARTPLPKKKEEAVHLLAERLQHEVEAEYEALKERMKPFCRTKPSTNGSPITPAILPEPSTEHSLPEKFAYHVNALLPLAAELRSTKCDRKDRTRARELTNYGVGQLANVLFALASEKSHEMEQQDQSIPEEGSQYQ